MIAVALRHIVQDLQPVGVHDRETDRIVARDVADHRTVVGIHVMDGKAHILHHIVAENILAAGIGIDAVAAIADRVAHDLRTGRIPD